MIRMPRIVNGLLCKKSLLGGGHRADLADPIVDSGPAVPRPTELKKALGTEVDRGS